MKKILIQSVILFVENRTSFFFLRIKRDLLDFESINPNDVFYLQETPMIISGTSILILKKNN